METIELAAEMQTSSTTFKSGDRWYRDFPRLGQLRDGASSLALDTFFHRMPQTVADCHHAREVYRELESDLAAMDEVAWPSFKSKVLKCDLSLHGHQGYRAITDILAEAKGYSRLKHELDNRRIRYDQIVPIPENRERKTPDWSALYQESPVALLEVKRVHKSDEQSKYIYENTQRIRQGREGVFRRPDPRIADGLWEKIQSTVDRARQQLGNYVPTLDILRIAFVIVEFDDESTSLPENYETVRSFLNNLSDGMFQVAHEFRGLNAPK